MKMYCISFLRNDFATRKLFLFHKMNTKAVLNQDFLTAYPFPHSVIPTFLNEEFIELLAKEVLELEFSVKSNDLYTFLQSADLLSVNSRSIVKFREEIYSEDFRNKLKDWTGIDLSPTVDLSAHIYPPSGYLLCHDDDIGKDEDCRRIAFILYLVDEDWSERDGGRLQLFDKYHRLI
jgi:Rps23 Pro-64 3,4-dihydroxylase Tpa1-like proline 4-hydroxylase